MTFVVLIVAARWNGGGSFRGREWSEKEGLPSDAEIAMHCVAAYFDSRLPPAHGVVDGRTFRYATYIQSLPDDDDMICLIILNIRWFPSK